MGSKNDNCIYKICKNEIQKFIAIKHVLFINYFYLNFLLNIYIKNGIRHSHINFNNNKLLIF